MIPSLIDFFTADSKQFGELVGTSNLFSLDVGKQGVRIVWAIFHPKNGVQIEPKAAFSKIPPWNLR